jgi:hypothetical protein
VTYVGANSVLQQRTWLKLPNPSIMEIGEECDSADANARLEMNVTVLTLMPDTSEIIGFISNVEN